MGEIFERVLPADPLEWTGERLTSEAGGQVEIEHLHRYVLARDFCRGLDVLDVASGEGYGTALLAQVARSATGVEISVAAAGHAAAQYRAPNLRYLQGDARKLPLADDSVDVVVSFETIEHFYEQDQFLAEVKRVLRPGGSLVVSSPDRDVYSPVGSPANEFHVRELSRIEFADLLDRYFVNVRLLGQRPIVGSVLLTDEAASGPTVTIERRGPHHFERSDGLPRAIYLVALASDADLPPLPNSVFIDSGDVGPILARAADHGPVVAALAETRQRAEAAEAAFHASREEIGKCMREAAEANDRASAQIAAMQEALNATAAERAAERAEHRPALTELAAAADARSAAEAERDNAQAERDSALAKAEASQSAHDAALVDLREACAQRDVARIALRRAAVFAETSWSARLSDMTGLRDEAMTRVVELESILGEYRYAVEVHQREGAYWRMRYDTLRARLERLLRRTGLYQLSRLVPGPVRRSVRRLLAAGGRS